MILAYDEQIPLITDYFSDQFTLQPLISKEIIKKNIADADLLLVRSVTTVNQSLIANTNIKYVATATSGADHIDHAFLKSAGIAYYAAQSCNANSVAQYVLCTIALLQQQKLLPTENLRVGIIGMGHCGQLVADYCRLLNYQVIVNDPPRATHDNTFISTPLSAFKNLDIVCLHPALQRDGAYPSYQLINKNFLTQLPNGCVIVNASRGEIINQQDLLQYGRHLIGCFDVFANEPEINPEIIAHAYLATPHIAGYATESKARATVMVYQAICEHFQLPVKSHADQTLTTISVQSDWQTAALTIYNPMDDCLRFRAALAASNPRQAFQDSRRNYPLRHEFCLVSTTI